MKLFAVAHCLPLLCRNCHFRVPHRVPHCNLSGPVLRDTARLSQWYPTIARYGVFGVSTWPIGCDTPSPFSECFPFGEHAKWRCDTPHKGVSQRYLRDTLWKQGKWWPNPLWDDNSQTIHISAGVASGKSKKFQGKQIWKNLKSGMQLMVHLEGWNKVPEFACHTLV